MTTPITPGNIPWLVYGVGIRPVELGTRETFADVAATVAELLGVPFESDGVSVAHMLTKEGNV